MIKIMFSKHCIKVALPTAIKLGTIYFILNHGVALATGDFGLSRVVPALLQYIIPYLVCAYGYSRRYLEYQ